MKLPFSLFVSLVLLWIGDYSDGVNPAIKLPITIRSFTGGSTICIGTTASVNLAVVDRTSFGDCRNWAVRGDPTKLPYSTLTKSTCEMSNRCSNLYDANNRLVNHPDFDASGNDDIVTNLVDNKLGPDRKPQWTNNGNMNSMLAKYVRSSNYDFQDWFRDSYRNKRVEVPPLEFSYTGSNNTYLFASGAFFPLDTAMLKQLGSTSLTDPIWPKPKYMTTYENGKLITNSDNHQFSFCTEHHSFFKYTGTEMFSFTGDDDTWVFVNDLLAVDLGADHPPQSGSVDLSDPAVAQKLGLKIGGIYPFDYFECERHAFGSNVKITTSITPFCSVFDFSTPVLPQGTFMDWVKLPKFAVVAGNSKAVDSTIEFNSSPGSFMILQPYQLQAGFTLTFSVQIIGASTPTPTGQGVFSVNLKSSPTSAAPPIKIDFLSSGIIQLTSATSNLYTKTPLVPWLLNLFDGNVHNFQIVYLSVPDWIQVFADDFTTAILTMRGINIGTELGTSGAGNIEIAFNNNPYKPVWNKAVLSAVKLSLTVADYTTTKLVSTPSTTLSAGSTYSVTVQTIDKCNNTMRSGGFKNSLAAKLMPGDLRATVVDNQNGMYTYTWVLNNVGTYNPLVGYQIAGQAFNAFSFGTTLPSVTIGLGPMNPDSAVVNAVNTSSTSSGSMSLKTTYYFTITVTDVYNNTPDAKNGQNYLSAVMTDSAGSSANCVVTVTFNSTARAYVVAYSAETAGVYTIVVSAGGVKIASPKLNSIILGTVATDTKTDTVVIKQTDTKSLVPVIIALCIIIPVMIFAAWRLRRYQMKWRDRKKNHKDDLQAINVEMGETQVANPAYNKSTPGDRFALQNAHKKYEEKKREAEENAAIKEKNEGLLRTLDAELRQLESM